MTDRPIIFSGPMVRALLDGRKTQTRRALREQRVTAYPTRVVRHPFDEPPHHAFEWRSKFGTYLADIDVPYANGDRLWVREEWRAADYYDTDSPRHLPKSALVQYEATEPTKNGRSLAGRRRSPIHMPRWASRLTLTVTDVRVQRLQEISEADAKAEGVFQVSMSEDGKSRGWQASYTAPARLSPKTAFRHLWNSIHGSDAWDANPWVCALTFTVAQRNIDEQEKPND